MKKAIFLDREGTINEKIPGREFIAKIEDFKFLPNAINALNLLSEKDFLLIIITNQTGIGKGYYTEEQYNNVNEFMLSEFKNKNIKINGAYFCKHAPEENCECRKPNLGMVNQAKEDFDINLKESYVIGDKTSDIKLGENAGCKTILVKTGHAGKDGKFEIKPDFTAEDLYDAALIILNRRSVDNQPYKCL